MFMHKDRNERNNHSEWNGFSVDVGASEGNFWLLGGRKSFFFIWWTIFPRKKFSLLMTSSFAVVFSVVSHDSVFFSTDYDQRLNFFHIFSPLRLGSCQNIWPTSTCKLSSFVISSRCFIISNYTSSKAWKHLLLRLMMSFTFSHPLFSLTLWGKTWFTKRDRCEAIIRIITSLGNLCFFVFSFLSHFNSLQCVWYRVMRL